MRAKVVFAKRLKQARLRSGLTQEGLGILSGIDEMVASSRMNHYEQGKHEPDFGTIHRLAKVMGISAAFFFCEDDMLAEAVWEMSFVD
jgi:transcriptional regulator with XRE-family HTH domain